MGTIKRAISLLSELIQVTVIIFIIAVCLTAGVAIILNIDFSFRIPLGLTLIMTTITVSGAIAKVFQENNNI
jgi:hypothetical protein